MQTDRPGVPTAFWTVLGAGRPVHHKQGASWFCTHLHPARCRGAVLTCRIRGTEERSSGARGSKGRSQVRCIPLYSLSSLLGTAFSLSSRVCSWGYFLSLALWWETPALASGAEWSAGLGGWQPHVATARGKIRVPSTALCSLCTAPVLQHGGPAPPPWAPASQWLGAGERNATLLVSSAFYLEKLQPDREFAGS